MPIIISLLVAGSLVLAPAVSADILPSVKQESGIPTLHPAPVDAVTEQIWDALKGKTDTAVARILAKVPVLLSGARDDGVYLGIGRDYWTEHGGKQLYKQLKQHFPDTPLHLAPSTGVIRYAQKLPVIPAPDIKTVPTLKRIASPITKTAPENTPIRDNRTTISTIEIPHDTYAGDITVTTNIDHSFRSDLQVTLVAPSGVQTTLFDGRQRIDPTDNLRERFTTKQLHGQQARGTWQLQVTDTEPEDTGTLKSWSLAITPAQKTTVTNPDHIFFETFQDGLNDWSSSHWRATTPQKNVPGEGEGNIVAQAHGCLFCSLTSKPLNLSAYNEVHLSYYYRLDPGMQDNEFLTLSTITNGTATKLKTYKKQHATGHWQQETITLTNLTPQTRIQFTAFARNAFTSFAIDNVLLAAPAGTITATDTPDLAVTNITAVDNLFTTTLRNTNTTQTTHTVTFHKGTTTNRPISTITVTIPTNTTKQTKTALSTTPGTYYACLTPVLNETDTENNCASITIEELNNYIGSAMSVVPRFRTPTALGGDNMSVTYIGESYPSGGGTITLGGVENAAGVRGFISSAHVLAKPVDLFDKSGNSKRIEVYSDTNAFVFNRDDFQSRFLGKVYKMPSFRTEGDLRILATDAAFVAYPHPVTKKVRCVHAETIEHEEFCLDVGSSTYLERIAPLQVRSSDTVVHNVTGSKKPTEGLNVQTFGAYSNTVSQGTVRGNKFLAYAGTNEDGSFYDYIYIALGNIDEQTIPGDSGSPIYTFPDAQGNVSIVGVHIGLGLFGKTEGAVFTSWYDVAQEFNLKPIKR